MNAYDNADRYFALWEISLYHRQPVVCSLACAIRELKRANADGLVETLDGLPPPDAVFGLPNGDLEMLTRDIASRYFPGESDFESPLTNRSTRPPHS